MSKQNTWDTTSVASQDYALMVTPAAFVGPVMSSAVSFVASPGESIARTSTVFPFAARM